MFIAALISITKTGNNLNIQQQENGKVNSGRIAQCETES